MESAVLGRIGMGFITGVDDRPLDHRIEIHQTLEEVGPLGDLVVHGARLVFRSDLSRPRIDLPGHQERHQHLHDPVEGDRAGDQKILVVPIAVPLPVRIVLVNEEFFAAARPGHRVKTRGEDTLASTFERHELPGICAFRRGIFGMGAIHVQTAAVGQELVQQTVVLRTGPFAFTFYLKPPDIQQRVLVLVVPNGLGRGKRRVMPDQLDRVGHRIERVRVSRRDAKLGFRPQHAWYQHRSLFPNRRSEIMPSADRFDLSGFG